MTFASIKDIVEAEWAGRSVTAEYGKPISQTTTASVWYDITGAAGTPKSKQFFDATPLAAQQLVQQPDSGLYHGHGVEAAGYQKVLRNWRLWNSSAATQPCQCIVSDYLLYYPSVEDGETALQEMDNTNTLPRYTDGEGVQMIAVTISSRTGGQTFTVQYTNSLGVAGRVSQTMTQNAVAAPGTITTSSSTNGLGNPFIGLQSGDTGVRSVDGVQMNGPDTGFFAIVLLRPLAHATLPARTVYYEKDLLLHANEMPIIKDGAYLSQLILPIGNLSGGILRGNYRFAWN